MAPSADADEWKEAKEEEEEEKKSLEVEEASRRLESCVERELMLVAFLALNRLLRILLLLLLSRVVPLETIEI